MYTNIREYRCDPSEVAGIAHIADEKFADSLADSPGFVAYEIIDCGDGRLFTLTVFTDRDAAEASALKAAEFIRDNLADVEIERLSAATGEVLVNRASSDVLEMVHA